MSVTLTALAWLLFTAVALVTSVFLLETLCGLLPLRRSCAGDDTDTPLDLVVLIPAHDEALGLKAILARINAVLPPGARILVVADNCTDATAAIARESGATAIERTDPERRGKGYALAYGRDHLAAAPPACVIVIDADCVPEPGALARIARTALARNAAVQCVNLLSAGPGRPPMVEISGFAFVVKNLVRQTGLARIGAPAILTGTGMGFPWPLFAQAPLASGELAEDLTLGIDLVRTRRIPRFEPDAHVWSAPSASSATLTQRPRWENGFLAVARKHALPLLRDGLGSGHAAAIWMGLHLLTPPLALLVLLNLTLSAAFGLLAALGGTSGPLLAEALLLALLLPAIGAAWALHGRAQMRASTVLRIPFYVAWKIPIYLRLLSGGEKRWVRTERDPGA